MPARVDIAQRSGGFARQIDDVDEDEDYTDYEIVLTSATEAPVIRTIPSRSTAPESSPSQPGDNNNLPMWKRRQSRKHTEAPPRLKEVCFHYLDVNNYLDEMSYFCE